MPLNALSAAAQDFCCIDLRVTRGFLALNRQLAIPAPDQAAGWDQAAGLDQAAGWDQAAVMELQFLEARQVAVIPQLGVVIPRLG